IRILYTVDSHIGISLGSAAHIIDGYGIHACICCRYIATDGVLLVAGVAAGPCPAIAYAAYTAACSQVQGALHTHRAVRSRMDHRHIRYADIEPVIERSIHRVAGNNAYAVACSRRRACRYGTVHRTRPGGRSSTYSDGARKAAH